MKTLIICASIAALYAVVLAVFALVCGDKPAGFDDK